MNSWNEIEREFEERFVLKTVAGHRIKCFHLGGQKAHEEVRSFLKEIAHKEYLRGRREAVVELPDDWDFRVRLAKAVMDKYHSVPKTGSFFFDDIDAEEVLQAALEEKVTD